MIPIKLDIENFLSFGKKVSINFSGDKLWIISGENGVGKSTIFDAITYCLFSKARGAKVKDLIRQGTNGFRLSYTFRFGTSFYRITRNHNGRTPTQSAERADDVTGPWKAVPNATGATAVDKWVEDLLGISYEMYASSIMLEQGNADAIITAKGPKRREILKQILGIDRFEVIWKRIDADRLVSDRSLKSASAKLQALTAVTADDVTLAAAAQAKAEEVYIAADEQHQQSAGLTTAAAEWERLTAEVTRLQTEIDSHSSLLSRRAEIEANAARLTLLERLVPALATLRIATSEAEFASNELTVAEERYTADGAKIVSLDEEQQRERERVREAQQRLDDLRADEPKWMADADTIRRELQVSEAIAKLARELAVFPLNLDEDQLRDRAELANVEAEEIAARAVEATLTTQHATAQNQLTKFDSIGGECSECGQTVTAEHADKERGKLRDALAQYAAELLAVASRLKSTKERKKKLKADIDERDKLARDRHATTQRLADARSRRTRAEVSDEVLRAELSTAESHLTTIATALPALRAVIEPAKTKEVAAERLLKTLRTEQDKRGQVLAKLRADYERKFERQEQATKALAELPPPTADERTLATEWEQWKRFPIRAEAERLAVAVAEHERRKVEHAQAMLRLTEIPEAARKPKALVEVHVKSLAAARKEADARRTEADAKHRELLARHAEYETAQVTYRTAERDAALKTRLSELLGPTGLQRELVRNAEREILREGSKLLLELSDDKLTLETTVDADADAFELCVRKQDLPDPIDAAQLAGGEKFRTAVAVAVAISRFAAKRLRPLECVMIDEGFGSLDQAGRTNITNALERLKQHVGRILIVSHEPSFAEAFSSRIQLVKSPEGTVVER